RYAEVLLLYAEACAMTNDNDGLQYLNAIQDRAGAPRTSLTMENVKKEKMFEMYQEGVRYEDLVRWGDAVKELGANGSYVPNFQDEFWLSNETKPHHAVLNEADAYYNGSNCGFKAGKNELMPYPFGELSINENIEQNPGW
ncbi:MAG: RagB/SusD family nutrient uptake outer membrane protein, partial [Bacteroidales bacterium]|nr:RagB/SusD family nutrient uptake outer membrane protein [Candidatus Cryptobacteroides caccocaballi]